MSSIRVLQTLGLLETYIVFKLRACGIIRGVRKLPWTLMLKKKIVLMHIITTICIPISYTTRKSVKTNEIFTDKNYFVSNFVGIYRQKILVGDTVGIYRRSMSVAIYRPYHIRII